MPKKNTVIEKAVKQNPVSKKPPKPKNTDRSKPVGFKEAEEMFNHWLELELSGKGRGMKGGGRKGVATQFGRDMKTILRIAKKYDWKKRYDKIQEKIKAASDRKIVKKEISNIDLVKALVIKSFKQLNRPQDIDNLRVTDFVSLGRFHEELLGNITASERDDVEAKLTQEQLDKAVKLLDSISDKEIQELARYIVEQKED